MDALPSDMVLVIAHLVADKRLPVVLPLGLDTVEALAASAAALYSERVGSLSKAAQRWAVLEPLVVDARRALNHLLVFAQASKRVYTLLGPRWKWIYTELAALCAAAASPREAPRTVPDGASARWYELAAVLCARPPYEDEARSRLVECITLYRTEILGIDRAKYRGINARLSRSRNAVVLVRQMPEASIVTLSAVVRAQLARNYYARLSPAQSDMMETHPQDLVFVESGPSDGVLYFYAVSNMLGRVARLPGDSVEGFLRVRFERAAQRSSLETQLKRLAPPAAMKRARDEEEDEDEEIHKFRRFELF